MSTSVRYVGPLPEIDIPAIDLYSQARLSPFEVEDREVAESLLASDDFERPKPKKAAAKKAAPSKDPAPAGEDPATPADEPKSEED